MNKKLFATVKPHRQEFNSRGKEYKSQLFVGKNSLNPFLIYFDLFALATNKNMKLWLKNKMFCGISHLTIFAVIHSVKIHYWFGFIFTPGYIILNSELSFYI